MRDAVSIPVTVKHRIGIDRSEDYGLVRDFVGRLQEAGCDVFIVHARNAWLKGLSPKENREVPPLRYEVAYRLAADFPRARIVLNGGIASLAQAAELLQRVDGVMVGRAAYHDPYLLATVDRELFGDEHPQAARAQVVAAMSDYLERQAAKGVPPRGVLRHMLQLFHGEHGARNWRRLLSDAEFIDRHGAQSLHAAARTFAVRRIDWNAAAVSPAG